MTEATNWAAIDGRVAHASLRDLLILMVVALALLAPGLSSLPPVDRDEPRYAVATTEMLQSHNFIDIRYQAQPRYLQPAGVYWLQSIPTALFSLAGHRAIWTFRLASLFGAVFAVVMTGFLASRLLGRQVGLSAAVFLGACLSLGFEAKIAKTDAALLGAVVVAQFALMHAYLFPNICRRMAAAFWVALGVGVLLKGPIVILVSGLTVIALIAWDRKAAWLQRLRPIWGAPLALLVAAPWYIAIGVVSAGEFFRIAIGRSMLGKVSVGQQAHGGPFGYHLMAFPLTFWPASLLAVMAIPFVWRERRQPAVRFLIAWITPSWIVFEIVKTKLPHYVLPLFPAIACLTALALFSPKVAERTWVRVLMGLFLVFWAVLSVILNALGPYALWTYMHQVDPLALLVSLISLLAAATLAWFAWRGEAKRAVTAVAVAAVFGAFGVYVLAAPRLQTFWISPRVEALVQSAKPCPKTTLISTPYHEPSLVFMHGPYDTNLAETPVQAAETMAKDGACAVALVGEKQKPDFLARAGQLALALRPLGQVQGRDYADNKNLTLILYGPAAPGAAAHGR